VTSAPVAIGCFDLQMSPSLTGRLGEDRDARVLPRDVQRAGGEDAVVAHVPRVLGRSSEIAPAIGVLMVAYSMLSAKNDPQARVRPPGKRGNA